MDDLTTWLPPVAVPVIGSLLTYFGVRVQNRRGRDALDSLDRSIEIRKKLEATSRAGLMLDSYIEQQITELSQTPTRRRDPSYIAIGLGMLFIGAGLAIPPVRYGGWWSALWAVAAFFLLIGLYGFIQGMVGVNRDKDDKKPPVAPDAAADSEGSTGTSGT
jgi:hypothetical protein